MIYEANTRSVIILIEKLKVPQDIRNCKAECNGYLGEGTLFPSYLHWYPK